MAPPPSKTPSSRSEYIETESGNKISRRATILGPKHIVLAGKCVIQENVVVHGDLVRPPPPPTTSKTVVGSSEHDKAAAVQDSTSVHLGRYVFISQGCTLQPPSRVAATATTTGDQTAVVTYYPLRISDHVYVGPNSVVRAAEIRSNVYIGANCVVGNMVIIKDNVKVLDGAVLPANSVWVSGCVVGGAPARIVGDLGEAWAGGGSVTAGGAGGVGDEGVGVRSRERWASVGSKR